LKYPRITSSLVKITNKLFGKERKLFNSNRKLLMNCFRKIITREHFMHHKLEVGVQYSTLFSKF